MTDSKEFEPLPAYLARVSSLFVFLFTISQWGILVDDFPMGYITLLTNEEDGFHIRCLVQSKMVS
jgi:hypothetical protein